MNKWNLLFTRLFVVLSLLAVVGSLLIPLVLLVYGGPAFRLYIAVGVVIVVIGTRESAGKWSDRAFFAYLAVAGCYLAWVFLASFWEDVGGWRGLASLLSLLGLWLLGRAFVRRLDRTRNAPPQGKPGPPMTA